MTYTKYSASGNDFIISHTFLEKDYTQKAIELCNRTQGIGADGFVVLVPDYTKKADFKWLFYNSDGSEASMCGNASRAVAHYAYENNLAKESLSFITKAGIIKAKVEDNIVQSQLTSPKLLKDEFSQDGFSWYFIDTGVPHLVTLVDDLDKFDLDLCKKLRYEYNTNVNFAKIEDEKIYVRTYERGVEAETLACGTGMAACFIRANNLNLVPNVAFVYPKSKEELTLSKKNDEIFFKGKVQKSFITVL